MKVNPADRGKAAILAIAIVVVLVFAVMNLLKRPTNNAVPPEVAAAPSSSLPSTQQLADGQILSKPKNETAVNLNALFAVNEPEPPSTPNPFRMPVPPSKSSTPNNERAPNSGAGIPTASQPQRQIDFGESYKPMGVDQAPTGPTVDNSLGIQVKGIISPIANDGPPMAFVKVGEITKGYRIGQQVAPGVSIVGISQNQVSFKVGAQVLRVSVGQDVKPDTAKEEAVSQ